MTKFISPRCLFLIGVLAGVVLQLPYIHWLQKTPAILAETIPTSIYNDIPVRTFVIRNVPTLFPSSNSNLRITIASSSKVNYAARQVFSLGREDELAGFYDPIEHEIWCVNSVEVLIHELKHVHEGAFHRNL